MPPADDWPIPEAALSERFLAATGPGGQNVNKVATAVQLRLDVLALCLAPEAYRRLKAIAGTRMTLAGEIVLMARAHRTREANRADARARLGAMLAKAHVREARRVKTEPSKAAKARRVDTKAQRGVVKQGRGRPAVD